MKLKLFTIKDVVAGEAPLILTAQNEAMLLRQIKSGMLAKQPNFLNTHIADKQIFEIGEYDLATCEIAAIKPVMIKALSEVFDDLVEEVRIRNKQLEGLQPPEEVKEIHEED